MLGKDGIHRMMNGTNYMNKSVRITRIACNTCTERTGYTDCMDGQNDDIFCDSGRKISHNFTI